MAAARSTNGGVAMDDDVFNPEYYLLLIVLCGLAKGWSEVMERDVRQTGYAFARAYGMLFIAGLALDLRYEGLAWASVLHFVLKYLGAYHGARLLSWAVTATLARYHLIRPPRDGARGNP